MTMKITIEDSFIFSLIKWKFLSKTDFLGFGDMIEKYPLLGEIQAACGFCELNKHCNTCVLCEGCRDSDLYDKWVASKKKKDAKRIYDAILEKANEWEVSRVRRT